MTTKEVTQEPIKDCLACKITGTLGSLGIGAYLANFAFKNKSFIGRVTFSTLSLAFISLGVARYEETYPFDKKKLANEKLEKK